MDKTLLNNFIDTKITFGCEFEFTSKFSRHGVKSALELLSLKTVEKPTDAYMKRGYVGLGTDLSIRTSPGSNAHEIQTPILKGVRGLLKLDRILRAIKLSNARQNISCGGHVHFGNVGDLASAKRIVKFYLNNESLISDYVSPSRGFDSNSYHMSLQSVFARRSNKPKVLFERVCKGKYFNLSFRNFDSKNTFENRHLEGTLDYNRLITWVVFNQAIIRYCNTHTRIPTFLNHENLFDALFNSQKNIEGLLELRNYFLSSIMNFS